MALWLVMLGRRQGIGVDWMEPPCVFQLKPNMVEFDENHLEQYDRFNDASMVVNPIGL